MHKVKYLITSLLVAFSLQTAQAQCPCDCPYPVLFLHGWTGSPDSWSATFNDPYFKNIWGSQADVFHAAPNAKTTTNIAGVDGIFGNADDDIQWVFANENNVLNPGCIYAMNFDVGIDGSGNLSIQPLAGGSPGYFHSDNNESSITKQGALVGKAIQAILAANPTKKKVILVGHSMGGLASREYLQRRVNNNATSTPRWWVAPSAADGHKVAKLLTLGTPHRGSNTMGNFSNLRPATGNENQNEINEEPITYEENTTAQKTNDILPDLASEAVRDLRYSYDNINIFSQDYPGVYLYGGKESDIPTFPYSYWTNDVNCNGTVNTTTQIGINQNGKSAGFAYEWDGTRDNPTMPLPTNVRYTYYVSNTLNGSSLAGGDLVVDDQRQWLYTNGTGTGATSSAGTPAPSDGVANRLSDRIYVEYGPNHLGETADMNNLIRGLDEGDYPAFAADINKNVTYAGMAQVRATLVPESTNTTDVDWYKFTMAASSPVSITLNTTTNLAGRLDFYATTPSNYLPFTTNGSSSQTFTASTTSQTKTISLANLNAGTYYVRVRHNNVGTTNWRTPYRLKITANAGSKMAGEGEEITNLNENPILNFTAVPNPVNGNGEILLSLSKNTPIHVEMLDLMGKSVQTLYQGDFAQPENTLAIGYQTESIAAGIYLIQVTGDGISETIKVVVNK